MNLLLLFNKTEAGEFMKKLELDISSPKTPQIPTMKKSKRKCMAAG
jgi:hypothetical protein